MARARIGWCQWSGMARRLLLAFAAIIAMFGFASWVTWSGFGEAYSGLRAIPEHEEGVRLALELASAVRDQYAHQAHTIIIGDRSHLGFYDKAQKRVLDLARRLRARADDEEETTRIKAIEQASGELDQIFRERIVPAVLSGETEDVHMQHEEGLDIVGRIQDEVDGLVQHYEDNIASLQAKARTIESSTRQLTVSAFLLALLLATAIGLYISRMVAVPVARLREGAARVSQGELNAAISIDGPDEFGDLARQFNAMTASLRDHQQMLLQSERLAGIGKLAAGVAHEINNPLGVILGYARLLRQKVEPSMNEDLKVIEDEVLRCREIVEGLLDLSRPLKVPDEPIDLREVCDDIAERLHSTTPKGIAIDVRGGGAAPAHPQKLRQVVLNLVKNALEACGEAGKVEVEIEEEPSAAIIRVSDTGPGLSEEARSRLFEPFFTTKGAGTGLGLAVSQAIVRAHDGLIEAGTGACGGAVFTVRLPRGRWAQSPGAPGGPPAER